MVILIVLAVVFQWCFSRVSVVMPLEPTNGTRIAHYSVYIERQKTESVINSQSETLILMCAHVSRVLSKCGRNQVIHI